MPSFGCKAWGLLSGCASDVGAILGAKLGVPCVIPVKGITGERKGKDYVIMHPDINKWEDCVRLMMRDKSLLGRATISTAPLSTSTQAR